MSDAIPSIAEVRAYLDSTPEESWCVDVVRTKARANCFFGHLFDIGGNDLWELFEECYATTYMVYPVNDGKHPKYQQPTAKQRCIAYLDDLIAGVEMRTPEVMEADARQSDERRFAT